MYKVIFLVLYIYPNSIIILSDLFSVLLALLSGVKIYIYFYNQIQLYIFVYDLYMNV